MVTARTRQQKSLESKQKKGGVGGGEGIVWRKHLFYIKNIFFIFFNMKRSGRGKSTHKQGK